MIGLSIETTVLIVGNIHGLSLVGGTCTCRHNNNYHQLFVLRLQNKTALLVTFLINVNSKFQTRKDNFWQEISGQI